MDAEDIRAALLSDDTKFAGGNIDTTISSRADWTKIYIDGDGTDILLRDDAQKGFHNDTYVKKKEFEIEIAGKYTVSFDMRVDTGGTAYGRVYVNGSPVGTERSTGSTSWQTYTQKITLSAGDLCQLYVYFDGNYPVQEGVIKNFRLIGALFYKRVGVVNSV